jgi:hypothetical protein
MSENRIPAGGDDVKGPPPAGVASDHTQPTCDHPPHRLHAYLAYDRALVVCCNECGCVIAKLGAASVAKEE